MSVILRISQAKPNPAGKPAGKEDVAPALPQPHQLLGEWVDVENAGTESITFSSIQLHHTLFNDLCQTRGQTELYWNAEGVGYFKPAQILRVHTGSHRDKRFLSAVDEEDADWHAYAERDGFVLNNRCGDIVIVTWRDEEGRTFKDVASYAPNPPVNAILKRLDNKLIVEDLTITS